MQENETSDQGTSSTDDAVIVGISASGEVVVQPDSRLNVARDDSVAPGWFEDWKVARSQDAERLDRLESATERMAASAAGLNATLSTFATKSQVEQVVLTTKADVREQDASVRQAMEKQRRRMAIRIYIAATVIGVLVLLIVTGAVLYTQGKTASDKGYKSKLYEVCQARQAQADAVHKLVTQPPDHPLSPTEAARAKVNAAILIHAFPNIDCGKLKP